MKFMILLSLALTGCALEPNSIRVEAEHTSHISQHFVSPDINAGFDALMVVAHWEGHGLFLDVGDGINLSPHEPALEPVYGGLVGPRETFVARAGYEIRLK